MNPHMGHEKLQKKRMSVLAGFFASELSTTHHRMEQKCELLSPVRFFPCPGCCILSFSFQPARLYVCTYVCLSIRILNIVETHLNRKTHAICSYYGALEYSSTKANLSPGIDPVVAIHPRNYLFIILIYFFLESQQQQKNVEISLSSTFIFV
jgi:hypothetical protein